MRSISWAAFGVALGAGLAGLLAIGGSVGAVADGMYGYGGKTSYYRPSRAVRPAPRVQRYYYRGVRAYRPCGQFKYRSKGRCLDARTNPPDLD